jgi:predicted glycosyltransferase
MIEMYPFGRRKFAFELQPLLEANRRGSNPARVVSSVRDILVSKRDQARHEEFACLTLNRFFDLVLVHSDPSFQTLEESFHRAADLTIPVVHTGFVAEPTAAAAPQHGLEPIIVASIGGGRVGFELLQATIAASRLLPRRHQLKVFAGPHHPDDQFRQLEAAATGAPWIHVQRFATDFADQMATANLSISMAGYNTCMNIAATGVRSLVFPFTGNGNEEQTVRARKFEELGVVHMLTETDLNPAVLKGRIQSALREVRSNGHRLDLNGVHNSVIALARVGDSAHV